MSRHLVVPASAIRAVIVTCKECGLQMIPGEGRRVELKACPVCHEEWVGSGKAEIVSVVNDMLSAIAGLKKANVEIRIELEDG